jgi:hypothetical protein
VHAVGCRIRADAGGVYKRPFNLGGAGRFCKAIIDGISLAQLALSRRHQQRGINAQVLIPPASMSFMHGYHQAIPGGAGDLPWCRKKQ